MHATEQCISLEHATRIVVVQGQQCPGRITDLRQGHLHAPQLTLVAKTVFAHQLQLLVQTFLLERPAWLEGRLAICIVGP